MGEFLVWFFLSPKDEYIFPIIFIFSFDRRYLSESDTSSFWKDYRGREKIKAFTVFAFYTEVIFLLTDSKIPYWLISIVGLYYAGNIRKGKSI